MTEELGLVNKESMRILHVDDEADFLKVSKRCLETEGNFKIDTALSVDEAMKKLKKKTYDAIIADYKMPKKDGLEFLRELKGKGDNTPFIIFTGKGREEVAIQALNLGADQYINKIGDPKTVYAELANSVEKAVNVRKAEEELKNTSDFLNNVLSNMSDFVFINDEDYTLRFLNDAAKKYYGDRVGEKCYKVFRNFNRPCYHSGVRCEIQEILEKGKDFLEDKRLTDAVGRITHIRARPTRMPDGKKGIIAVSRDVTQEKQAEEKLKESEAKYRSLIDGAGSGVANVDVRGRFTYVNKALCEMIGYTKEEMIGKHFADFLHPEDKKDIVRKFLGAWKHPRRKHYLEYRVNDKDGHPVYMNSSPTLLIYKNKLMGFNAIIEDITERKKAEKTIREINESYERLTDNADEAIFRVKAEGGEVIYANPAAERIFGYSLEDWLADPTLSFKMIHPGYAEKQRQIIEEINTSKKPIKNAVLGWVAKDGHEVIMEYTIIPVTDNEGKITYFESIGRDITELMQSEKSLKEALKTLEITNEKLSVSGKLTRHDVRNKLQAISNSVFMVEKKLAGDREALGYLDEIKSTNRQAEEIFDFARSYEMIGTEELKYMNAEKSIKEALSQLSDLQGIEVINECGELIVLVDSLLRQLFYNLIDNSLRHGEKVSRIKIYYKKARDGLKLIYEDNGIGIPLNDKERIFEEGYGKATGHGLYLIRKICEVYGWTIKETGKLGKGVQFTMVIPKTGEIGRMIYRFKKRYRQKLSAR